MAGYLGMSMAGGEGRRVARNNTSIRSHPGAMPEIRCVFLFAVNENTPYKVRTIDADLKDCSRQRHILFCLIS